MTYVRTTSLLLAGWALTLATPSLAYHPKEGPQPDEIRIEAENSFYGLGWEISVFKDAHGLQRITTVRDLATNQTVSETADISAKDALALWQTLEAHRCWSGPTQKDWSMIQSDNGTVILKHKGKQQMFHYTEYWDVVATVERFAKLNQLRATARQKGLGKNV
jgi:hypothetical protein